MQNPAKILIVDDDPVNVKLLAATVGSLEYSVVKAYSGMGALESVKADRPDIILMDIMMPDMNGLEVTSRLKSSSETSDIPVILVTSLDGHEEKTKGIESGADDFLNKPVNTAELKARVRSLLRLKQYSDRLKAHSGDFLLARTGGNGTICEVSLPRVMIVEDNKNDIKILRSCMNGFPCQIIDAQTGEQAVDICSNSKVDLIILDMLLPGIDGYEVIRRIKSIEATAPIQVVAVTSLNDIESKIRGIEEGADDFLCKPVQSGEFRARVTSLLKKKAYHDKLVENLETAVQAAILDRLTGLYNYGYFKHSLRSTTSAADRHGNPVSLMMVDVDNFKSINDTYGHIAGDQVLAAIAKLLKEGTRGTDTVARYGGEEFAIVMNQAGIREAAAMAERLRHAVEIGSIRIGDISVRVTISIGIAEYDRITASPDELIKCADRALYNAKSTGKNIVCTSTHLREPSLRTASGGVK